MAKNPESLATYAILESYVKMIAQKCNITYSKKADTIKKIEFSDAVPTGATTTTTVMCMICTYDDGTVINIDASPITSGLSDVVSTSYLSNALKDYTTTVDLDKDYLKKVDAYLPTNSTTLDLLTQDTSGNLLFNGKALASSSGGFTVDWDSVAGKPFSKIDTTTLSIVGDELTVTGGIVLDSSLSDTSANGVENKAIANEFKNYTTTVDLNTLLGSYVKNSDLVSSLSEYTKTSVLDTNYAKKTDLHSHSNLSVLDDISTDGKNLKYKGIELLTSVVLSEYIKETDSDLKYIEKANIETNTLDLSLL